MRKRLVIIGVAVASLAACGSAESSRFSPVNSSSDSTPFVSANTGAGIGDGAPTFIKQFRLQFPGLAAGESDQQILRDGEADCSDMAASRKLTTSSMAKRHSLSSSTADKFTLYNVSLLETFTLCGIR